MEIEKLKNTIIWGDCLQVMPLIPDESIDMVLADVPYGTTACGWDIVIPFQPMWEQLKRIIKLNGAMVLFGSEPFSSDLRMSNVKNYKYDWVWNKVNAGNFVTAKYKPLSICENIMIFSKNYNKVNYFPIMEAAIEKNKRSRDKECDKKNNSQSVAIGVLKYSEEHNENVRFPKNMLCFNNRVGDCNATKRSHPTQKPVALMEYLIKTYTQENELVLDFTMGSGTTGIACKKKLNRIFIGIEKSRKFIEVFKNRIGSDGDGMKFLKGKGGIE